MIHNSDNHYGLISILIHWLMALCIFFMFGLGLYMVELSYYDSWYRGSLQLHKSLGICLMFSLALRIAWKLVQTSPKPLAGPKWEQVAARTMHILLYVVLIILMLTGYLISTADGRAILVFDLFSIPALGASIENQEDIAGQAHLILAWFLITMVAMHALAALKHQFINQDGGLSRMLKPSPKK